MHTKFVMTLRGKKTGPNTYEGSASGPGGTSTYKTTISAHGQDYDDRKHIRPKHLGVQSLIA